ncbi:MAG: fructose-bisphosphate aldolase class I [Chloroflexi bacterium]|nr:fructose-bisphosphate aldolase class I [Chloroflexota bacterium]
MDIQALRATAQQLVAPAKGILAADESTGTMARRLESIGAESTEENRRDYREMLFRTVGASDYVSGVILYDETIRQKAADGTPLVEVLQAQGVIPGIKVDAGLTALPGAEGELATQGLDGLRERLAEYRELGARFTKWRALLNVGPAIPSSYAIEVAAHGLARYAALAQEAGLVPIVEPEVLMDGGHDVERCEEATEALLREVFRQLAVQRVALDGMLLKPNMVVSGSSAPNRARAQEVAERTVALFLRIIPPAMPGVVFMSGGQSDDDATTNLQAIAVAGAKAEAPWQLTYSYGRGLQALPLATWAGESANVKKAQRAFLHRCRVTSAARQGAYEPAMEKELAAV